MVLMCSEPPALCRASHSLQASRLCFVFDTSSSPLVVTMSSCSLMESFWLLQGIFHCFSLCRLHLSSHAATAPEVLRGLSSSSPNKRAADVHPQATLVSVRTSRVPVVRPGWAWSRGLPHPRGSTHPCATTSTGACKISIDGFHEQGEGPVRILSWCCHCPTTTTCRKSTTTTCKAHTFHFSSSIGALEFVCVRAWFRSQRRRKDSQLWSCHSSTIFGCRCRSPPCSSAAGSASELHGGEARPSESLIPPPIPATTELVEDCISRNFHPLENISTNVPPEVGESILWRGVKTGRHGQPSTKVEHFQGKVRSMELDQHQELYLYLD